MLLLSLFLCSTLFIGTLSQKRDFHIDYQNNQFIRDGQPFRYISGSMHYFRTHPSQWIDRLKMARAAGLNAIETYVPWNYHETLKGQYDFSGSRNLTRFISLAADQGLSVILRPGPYICAEWENGGLPYWLLKYPNISLRSSQEDFIRETFAWWDVLLPIVKPLMWNNGGPVIMVQIENEYGSFGCDKVYLGQLRDRALLRLGNDSVLFTTDPPEVIVCGRVDGVFATIDFGERGLALGDEYWQIQKKANPVGNGGPRVNSEYYPGWYVTWGAPKPYKHFTTNEVSDLVNYLWSHNSSFNFYMFHGGTNFEFWNGAEHAGALITSYDYWAPMSENGLATDKYNMIRNFIQGLNGWSSPPLPVPAPAPTISAKSVALAKYGNVLDFMPQMINKSNCMQGTHTFEDLDQPFGYVLYSFKTTTVGNKLTAPELRDFGYTYVDSQYKGCLSPAFHPKKVTEVNLSAKAGAQVDILVESQGRLTWESTKDFKGLLSPPLLDATPIDVATSCPVSIKKLPSIVSDQSRILQEFVAGDIYVGQFTASTIGDTNIDMTSWGRGLVWINGYLLGKYWSTLGPQKSLYIPAPLLQQTNEIVIMELEKLSPTCGSNTIFCSFNLIPQPIPY